MKNALANAVLLSLGSLLSAQAAALPSSAAPMLAQAAPATPASDGASTPAAKEAAKEDEDEDEDKPKQPDPNLPLLNLSPDLLYRTLASEIAAQRGQWQSSYVTLLSLAQQTRDPRLARRAMEVALSAKQMNEGMNAVRLWRELSPTSDEAAQYHMALAVMQDKLGEVLPLFQKRIQDSPLPARGAVISMLYQRYLNQAKDKKLLFSQLEQLLAPHQSFLEARLVLAQAALAKGDSARAQQEANAALAIKPDSELALMTLIYVTDNLAQSQKLAEDFLTKHPQAHEARLSWARMLIERKQYTAARSQFEVLLGAKYQELTCLYALGVINLQLKDYKSAQEYLQRWLNTPGHGRDDGRDPNRVRLMLSQIAEELGQRKEALDWLEKINDSDSSQYLNATLRRAQLLAKDGKLEEARQLLQQQTPQNEAEKVQVLQMEVALLREANRMLEAYARLEQGLQLAPSNTDLLYEHAMLAEKLQRYAVMESSLRKVIKLAPDNHHAYNALGYSLAERNIRLAEAQTLIEKALQLAPDDPFILDSLGWVQFRQGKLKEAEITLRRAYSLRPDAEIGAHLAEVLWQAGQKEAAEKVLREAAVKDPSNDTLKTTLNRLQLKL
ncbi:tetratricopeptide repeat protein [Massilia sp. W12]|uniref:tetratricopeptide repeat protein n=1 Tax=Massilia sp. W12 TaxID=3126507 RepID=UPI0030D4E1B9